ncbi:Hsp20/alpha crystallin family protein [Fluviispira sanaruensis]|uniref:Hsp20/alpha crystallin family protein n=1 Tax=Fluviispira sanaruensis TaxID=2493639 RepID=A0A4P2VPN9_FLUSA|nr:Hsp20/alpha crystallin family protein [Fluviispira sanaruensis]BBH54200.1 Hsp20/alpha crystallin family protein [Fluviispira sanaruensis]
MSILQPFKKQNQLTNRPENDLFYSLQTDVNRLFNSFFNDFEIDLPSQKSKNLWAPRIDMRESAHSFIITADLPGIKKEDINVNIHDNILTIKGERKSETHNESDKHYISERYHGQFERSFSLPQRSIDKEKISAEMKNGELTINIAKIPEAQKEVRKIEIR